MNFIKSLFNNKKNDEKPYYDMYGDVPTHLEYSKLSMADVVRETAKKYPHHFALGYFGKNMTYRKLVEKIDIAAKSLRKIGVKENDRVTICMPNTPEAII